MESFHAASYPGRVARDSLAVARAGERIAGALVYAGMDWVDAALARRSMELMATEVMPRVNEAIGAGSERLPDRAPSPRT